MKQLKLKKIFYIFLVILAFFLILLKVTFGKEPDVITVPHTGSRLAAITYTILPRFGGVYTEAGSYAVSGGEIKKNIPPPASITDEPIKRGTKSAALAYKPLTPRSIEDTIGKTFMKDCRIAIAHAESYLSFL